MSKTPKPVGIDTASEQLYGRREIRPQKIAQAYTAMINDEIRMLDQLRKFGAVLYGKTKESPVGKLDSDSDLRAIRRRILVTVPPRAQARIEAAWPQLIEHLGGSRKAFLAALGTSGKRGQGKRTASLPRWIEPEKVAKWIRFSTFAAVRSARIRLTDLEQGLDAKIHELVELKQATTDPKELRTIEEILTTRWQDIQAVRARLRQHKIVVVRRPSGVGLKLNIKWADGTRTSTAIAHVTVVAAGDSCMVTAAPGRENPGHYTQPLTVIGGMEVYTHRAKR